MKCRHSRASLLEMSEIIMRRLENHMLFKSAQTVLLFHSLPDEPCTHDLILRTAATKNVILPVVVSETDLELRRFRSENLMKRGAFNIFEPTGEAFEDFSEIDLAVIPGVAFDENGNRLGRGRGYYDRLLERLKPFGVPTLGMCFDFQKLPHIPSEPHDIRVDFVL